MGNTIRIEPLGEGRRILVNERHTFGTDAFLLADFASPKKKENACDLGTGCGIIPTLWLAKGEVRTVLGIDISAEACELARQTAAANGDTLRFEVMNLDMKELKGVVDREHFDLVSCNPPYFEPGSGYISPDPQRAAARAELECSINDVCAAAAYLLRYGGRFCLCHRPERTADVICAMRANGIEPKRMRMVENSPGRAPWLILIEGRRGGKPSLSIEKPFIMRGEDGSDSEELARLYEHYRTTRGSVKQ
ncbi:MAG: methyltransferase [Clostridia bacterium]|nr:methyltransferase domain-containing protein [Oscillospiraceae bacterium]MBQ6796760.1 methyltransferase [Clostridia bacterium]